MRAQPAEGLGLERLMSNTEYDIESRLRLYLLLDEVRAAALKHHSPVVEASRYKMIVCIPANPLSVDNQWRELDTAVRDVFYLSGEWLRSARAVGPEMVVDAVNRALSLFNK
jgi:hypothetical protein